MNKILKSVFLLLSLSALIVAQQHPFPQNLKYPYGYVPKTIDIDWVKTEYDKWLKKSGTLTSCGSDKLFINAGGEYKVEAIGFAAFIFAYMGDSARFASTYNFYKANLTTAAGGMMGWHGGCGGPSDQGGATDGDVDVALGLIVAHWQWPNAGYLEKAIAVIKVLKKMVVNCKDAKGDSIKCLTMGYNFGGCSMTDISYYNPAAFREYAKVIGNAEDSVMWVKLANDTYTILNAGANATTGLVADRQSVTGSPQGNYADDACRTPWRITLDYLWNGNEKAKEWCIKISNFAKTVGIKKIGGSLSLSGQSGGTHESKYVGGFVIAAMANSQEMVDEFAAEMKNLNDSWNWFTYVLKFCYLITLTGNQWKNTMFDSVSISHPPENMSASLDQIHWKSPGNRELSVTGLQPGYAISLTDLSGKQLYSKIAQSCNADITITSIKNGCLILTIKNQNRKILKSGFISTMRSN
jgi:endo-1,4-beta-D-glucanase Y